jgi:hypothetical protein
LRSWNPEDKIPPTKEADLENKAAKEEAKAKFQALARETREALEETRGLHDYTSASAPSKRGANGKSKNLPFFTRRALNPQAREEILRDFKDLKATFLIDTIFFSLIGLSLVWTFFSFQDSVSYALGLGLGFAYALLLGRYVETLGESPSAGSARFLPVIAMVLVYGRNTETLRLIPELIGFMTYQAASFSQIFNTGEESANKPKTEE